MNKIRNKLKAGMISLLEILLCIFIIGCGYTPPKTPEADVAKTVTFNFIKPTAYQVFSSGTPLAIWFQASSMSNIDYALVSIKKMDDTRVAYSPNNLYLQSCSGQKCYQWTWTIPTSANGNYKIVVGAYDDKNTPNNAQDDVLLERGTMIIGVNEVTIKFHLVDHNMRDPDAGCADYFNKSQYIKRKYGDYKAYSSKTILGLQEVELSDYGDSCGGYNTSLPVPNWHDTEGVLFTPDYGDMIIMRNEEYGVWFERLKKIDLDTLSTHQALCWGWERGVQEGKILQRGLLSLGNKKVLIYNTHLQSVSEDKTHCQKFRDEQLNKIIKQYQTDFPTYGPKGAIGAVLTGDFNFHFENVGRGADKDFNFMERKRFDEIFYEPYRYSHGLYFFERYYNYLDGIVSFPLIGGLVKPVSCDGGSYGSTDYKNKLCITPYTSNFSDHDTLEIDVISSTNE